MCGIAGFFDFKQDLLESFPKYDSILKEMALRQKHRGPDENGQYLSNHFGLSHARLSIIDLKNGKQPMTKQIGEKRFGLIYNGELYNTKELRENLISKGWILETTSDTEVILIGTIEYGPEFVKQLNGIFAYCFIDETRKTGYLFRDRSGVKPLFYTKHDDTLVFASEQKALFCYPGITPRVDLNGLNEIFSIGPAKTYGTGVFKGIDELKPGYYLSFTPSSLTLKKYWELEARPHEDDYNETVEKTAYLVYDSIKRQMVSDVPICTFLSGGLDSSLVSAVCAKELKKHNKQLNTFSFDFAGNKKYFKSNDFQPSQDRPYAEEMAHYLKSNHIFLECDNICQADLLYDSVCARDLPAMADVDSSMLHFCKEVKMYNKVALTGECADEIFGGYPWFHKSECFHANTFPWTMDLSARKKVLSDDFLSILHMDDYVKMQYERSVSETPTLEGENATEKRRREISYLNLKWFMQTLLDRMDRTSMNAGLEARVPFADHRIIEYLFNVPWEMKCRDGIVKSLLRESGAGLLPDHILWRKKSPYPKTYDPHYESLLASRLIEVIETPSSPLLQFVDKKKLYTFISTPSDYATPWYGQLMAGPQMLAYLLMINFWLTHYHITVEL